MGSMAALLAPLGQRRMWKIRVHGFFLGWGGVVVTVLQNTEAETERGTTRLLPPSKQGGEPTSCVTVWIRHNLTRNMAAVQLSQLPG